ncbi:MAG: hypothetical protein K0Q72_282, partial [Armatimonadetes bacterium]|nr:hypothetical protein [Armatimonadota bacterium]
MVVLYHSFYPTVDPSDPFLGFNLSYQRLDAQLERLARSYRILDEAEFLEIAAGGFRNAGGTCLVTIDDGYRALCRPEVLDIFAARRVKPLLFLIAGHLEGRVTPWYSQLVSLLRRTRGTIRFDGRPWDLSDPVGRSLLYMHIERYFLKRSPELALQKLSELGEVASHDLSLIEPDMEPMSWHEAKWLREAGWSIGSHAWSHHPLASLGLEQLEQEMTDSKRLIEERMGFKVRTCSYPNGSENAAVREAAARHYEAGFAVNSGKPRDLFEIPRHDLGAYPFHDFLRFRKLHPAVEAVHGGATAEASGRERLRQKAEWITRHAWRRNGAIGAQQLILFRGVPERVEVETPPSPASKRTGRPRVAVLCRSNPWNRYAVSRLARELDLVGIVIERDPGDPVITAEVGDPNSVERGAYSLPAEARPWYPLDHPRGVLLDLTFGTSWEAFHVEPGTPALVLNPGESINSTRVEETLEAWAPDYIFVFGTSLVHERVYGKARRCAVNMHNGLSPEYRGSYTLWWPLYEGRPEYVGGTLHLLSPKIDGGAVFFQWQPRLDGSETPPELEMIVQRDGIEHVITLLTRLNAGEQ